MAAVYLTFEVAGTLPGTGISGWEFLQRNVFGSEDRWVFIAPVLMATIISAFALRFTNRGSAWGLGWFALAGCLPWMATLPMAAFDHLRAPEVLAVVGHARKAELLAQTAQQALRREMIGAVLSAAVFVVLGVVSALRSVRTGAGAKKWAWLLAVVPFGVALWASANLNVDGQWPRLFAIIAVAGIGATLFAIWRAGAVDCGALVLSGLAQIAAAAAFRVKALEGTWDDLTSMGHAAEEVAADHAVVLVAAAALLLVMIATVRALLSSRKVLIGIAVATLAGVAVWSGSLAAQRLFEEHRDADSTVQLIGH